MPYLDSNDLIKQNDFYFGPILVSEVGRYVNSSFTKLTNVFCNRVDPKSFTQHVRRMVSKHGCFQLTEGHSNASIAPLLSLIDPTQVDFVKIYTWKGSYNFFGLELVFLEGVAQIQSCWTFDGHHEEELKAGFWIPLQTSPLFQKTVLQNGDKLEAPIYVNLRLAEPTVARCQP